MHAFEYDLLGRLTRDDGPGGCGGTLTRSQSDNVDLVTLTSREDHVTTYRVETVEPSVFERRVTSPSGAEHEVRQDGGETEIIESADGTVVQIDRAPDPRFGQQAPMVASMTVSAGPYYSAFYRQEREVTLASPSNPLSATTVTTRNYVGSSWSGEWVWTRTYDAATHTVVTTSPMGRTTTALLEGDRVTQLSVPGLLPITFDYDDEARLASVTQGTRTVSWTRSPSGEVAAVTDALGRTTSMTHDARGRVSSVELPPWKAGATTEERTLELGYDGMGAVTRVKPPSQPSHGFTYTTGGLMERYSPPWVSNAGTLDTTYTWNREKAPTSMTRPDARTVAVAYDGFGRASSMTVPPRSAVGVTYDAADRFQTLTTPEGNQVTYAYEGFLPASTTWSGEVAGSVRWMYGDDFRLMWQVIDESAFHWYDYDADGRLTLVQTMSLVRDAANGLLASTTVGDVATTHGWTGYGESASFSADADGDALYAYTLGYDDGGQLTTKTETMLGVTTTYTYGYDALGRLETVSANGVVESEYVYDGNGNRLAHLTSTGTVAGVYDAQDRLLSSGTTAYAYTPNGELLTRSRPGEGVTTYTYDAAGNLLEVVPPTGPTITYVIDGQNRRIGKRVGGVLEQGFLYASQTRIVAELASDGALRSTFVYGTRGHVPDLMLQGAETYRLLTDQVGSVRLVVRTRDGAVIQRLDYDAFGNVLVDTNPGFQPFGFAGGLYDQDTGLVRFGARDYDPEIGRWTAKDPLRFRGGGLGLYEYARSAPTIFIDASGRTAAAAPLLLGGPAGIAAAGALTVALVLVAALAEEFDWTGIVDWALDDSDPKVAGAAELATRTEDPNDPEFCAAARVICRAVCSTGALPGGKCDQGNSLFNCENSCLRAAGCAQ